MGRKREREKGLLRDLFLHGMLIWQDAHPHRWKVVFVWAGSWAKVVFWKQCYWISAKKIAQTTITRYSFLDTPNYGCTKQWWRFMWQSRRQCKCWSLGVCWQLPIELPSTFETPHSMGWILLKFMDVAQEVLCLSGAAECHRKSQHLRW